MHHADRLVPPALRAVPRQRQAARHLALLAALAGASAPLLAVLYHVLGFDAAGMAVLTGATVMLAAPWTLWAGASLAVMASVIVVLATRGAGGAP